MICYKKRRGTEKMGQPNVLELPAPASLLLLGCLRHPQPQAGRLAAASDLLQLQRKQEHPGRLITPMSRYVSRKNLGVQVVMESKGLP